jgi:hypothetical protein
VNVSREWLIANGVSPEVIAKALGEPAGAERPAMNQTEERFSQLLEEDRWIEPILSWQFEVRKLQLAPDMTFLPDFEVITEDSVTHYIDVKGKHVWDDAIVKGKAAAVLYPVDHFYIAQLKAGEWHVRQLGVTPRKTWKIPA